jgi:hypothetical protein
MKQEQDGKGECSDCHHLPVTLSANRDDPMQGLTEMYHRIMVLLLTLTLIMDTEQVFKTLTFNSALIWLIT